MTKHTYTYHIYMWCECVCVCIILKAAYSLANQARVSVEGTEPVGIVLVAQGLPACRPQSWVTEEEDLLRDAQEAQVVCTLGFSPGCVGQVIQDNNPGRSFLLIPYP